MSRSTTKPTKRHVHPAKTQMIMDAQSDQSLRCVLSGYLRTHGVFMRIAKTDQTEVIWVFAGRTGHFVGSLVAAQMR